MICVDCKKEFKPKKEVEFSCPKCSLKKTLLLIGIVVVVSTTFASLFYNGIL